MNDTPISTSSTNPDAPNEGRSTNPELPPRVRGRVPKELRIAVTASALAHELVSLLPAPKPDEIRGARLAAGQNQSEAAALVGHSRWQTWSGWESGRKPMPPLSWTWYMLATGRHPRAKLGKRR